MNDYCESILFPLQMSGSRENLLEAAASDCPDDFLLLMRAHVRTWDVILCPLLDIQPLKRSVFYGVFALATNMLTVEVSHTDKGLKLAILTNRDRSLSYSAVRMCLIYNFHTFAMDAHFRTRRYVLVNILRLSNVVYCCVPLLQQFLRENIIYITSKISQI